MAKWPYWRILVDGLTNLQYSRMLLVQRTPIAVASCVVVVPILLAVWLAALGSEDADLHFVNWHYTVDVGGPFAKKFRPANTFANGTSTLDHSSSSSSSDGEPIQNEEFVSGLRALQDCVREAAADGQRLRAYGSRWSLSNIAYDDQYLVEPWGLNYYQIGLAEDQVTEAYRDIRDRLVFVQAGVMNRHINQVLLRHDLDFYTNGDGDGHRTVGAVSTGTHNSALSLAAIQDYVRGVHLVLPPAGEHVFIQRASEAVVTAQFCQFLDNARLIEDDELFGAVVVGLGSFGIIHGMLIEMEPIYHVCHYNVVSLDVY